MSDNLYTVSKMIPDFQKNGGNPAQLLRSMKNMLNEARNQNPDLANCPLHDVGFIQQENGLEVKLYFSMEG